MFYKPGDKILYSRCPGGDPKGVIVAVNIKNPKSGSVECCTQMCEIKCGTFEYTVANHYLNPRTVDSVEQVYVHNKFKVMPTKRLLARYRNQRHARVDDYYGTYTLTNKWSGDFEEFFNDIGVDDYYTKHQASKLIYAKFERDLLEMKYELSRRENVESRKGSKNLRRKIAKRAKSQGKSKNR